MEWERLLEKLQDPVVGGAAAAGALLVVVLLVMAVRRVVRFAAGRARLRAASDARRRLVSELKAFQGSARAVLEDAGPVFKTIREQTDFRDPVGHWRAHYEHSLGYRFPDFKALGRLVSAAGLDGAPLRDLQQAAGRLAPEAQKYDEGAMDEIKTPIASVAELEKGMQRVIVLATMCVDRYSA